MRSIRWIFVALNVVLIIDCLVRVQNTMVLTEQIEALVDNTKAVKENTRVRRAEVLACRGQ